MTNIIMPQIGESISEGKISSWLKHPGDTVSADEPIAEVETDKVSFEVPAPREGILAEIVVAIGQVAKVGDVLARLEDEECKRDTTTDIQLSSENEAKGHSKFVPSKINDAIIHHRPLSPAVRRLVVQHHLNINGMIGSGKTGRVTKSDLMPLIAGLESSQEQSIRSGGHQNLRTGYQNIDRQSYLKPVAAADDEVVQLSMARLRTAEHMLYSVQSAPHGYISFDVDYGNVDQLRKSEKGGFKAKEGFNLTFLPFICFAVAEALSKYQLINAVIDGDKMIIRKEINLSIAVDVNHQSLLVPVIKNIDGLSVRGIAREISRLAIRARERSLSSSELAGGTFTVTNPGHIGTRISVPIINQPQSAILVTDGIERRPSVLKHSDGSESLAIRPVGNIGLSMDHRTFDGAYAAEFLQHIKTSVETKNWVSVF